MLPTMQSTAQTEPGRWQGDFGTSTSDGSVKVKNLAKLALSISSAVECGNSEKILADSKDLHTRGESVRESITNPLIVVGHISNALSRREFQWLDLDSKVAITRVFGLYLSITVVINHEQKRQVYELTKTEFTHTIDLLANVRENKSEVRLRFELEFAREAIKMLSDTSNRAVTMARLLGRVVWNREIEAGLSFIWEQAKQLSRLWLVDVLLIRRCVTVGRTNIKDLSTLQAIIKETYRKNWHCCYAAVEVLGDIVRNGITPSIQQQAFFGTESLPGFRLFSNWGDLKIKTIFVESLLKMSAVADRIFRDEYMAIQMQYREHPDLNIRSIFETEKEKQEILSKRREIRTSRKELLVNKESLTTSSQTVEKEAVDVQTEHLSQKTHALEEREKKLAQREAELKEKQALVDRAIDFQEELLREHLETTKMHPALVTKHNIGHSKTTPQKLILPAANMGFAEQIFLLAKKKQCYVEEKEKLAIARKLIVENKHYFMRKGAQEGTLVVEYFEDKIIKKILIGIDEKERLLTTRKLRVRTLSEAMEVIPSGFSPIHRVDFLLCKDRLVKLKSKEAPATHIVYTLMNRPLGSFCISDGPDRNCLSLYFKKGEKILVKLVEIKEKLFYIEDPDLTQTTFASIKDLLQMYHLSSLVREHDIQTPPPSFTPEHYCTHIEIDDHYISLLQEKAYSTMMTADMQTGETSEVEHGNYGFNVPLASGATAPPQLEMTVSGDQELGQPSWQVESVRYYQLDMEEESKRHSLDPDCESKKDHNYLLTPNAGNQSDEQHYQMTPNK